MIKPHSDEHEARLNGGVVFLIKNFETSSRVFTQVYGNHSNMKGLPAPFCDQLDRFAGRGCEKAYVQNTRLRSIRDCSYGIWNSFGGGVCVSALIPCLNADDLPEPPTLLRF